MKNISKWMTYVEKTYLRGNQFPIGLWNQYDAAVNDLPRTNNSSEGETSHIGIFIWSLIKAGCHEIFDNFLSSWIRLPWH